MAELDPIRSTGETPATGENRERKEPIPFPQRQVREEPIEEPINIWKVAAYALLVMIALAAIAWWIVHP